jgi:pectin methylesterase-like acyl-CoA thioesterase
MGKITFAAALVACAGFEIVSAEAAIVVVSKTIQAAVDEANPGDIILVPPGTYRETVRVLKDSITILGSQRDSVVMFPIVAGAMPHSLMSSGVTSCIIVAS